MKKVLITILIILILAGVGYFAYSKGLIKLDFLKRGDEVVSENQLIQKFGSYTILDKNIKIIVNKSNGFVNININDLQGNSLIDLSNLRRFSAYQGWAILVDNQDNIWINSSDVGTFEVVMTEGRYSLKEFSMDELKEWGVPEKICNLYPPSLKNKIKCKL